MATASNGITSRCIIQLKISYLIHRTEQARTQQQFTDIQTAREEKHQQTVQQFEQDIRILINALEAGEEELQLYAGK